MRASGVLMHISSLPSDYGIGTLGKDAREFIDFLESAGQTYWQILPIGPTGYGDSPYQSFSTFAGNPYFIDLDLLCRDGLLKPGEFEACGGAGGVDYARLYSERFPVLRKAYKRFIGNMPRDFDNFCKANAFWLDDYAIFMAVKDSYSGLAWTEWEKPLMRRDQKALSAFANAYKDEISFYKMTQYLFFSQWSDLKEYAAVHGIKFIGDLAIYVSADSADVWASPEMFQLDENYLPRVVAGCPPDGFTSSGQLWGNPIYDWDKMRADGFSWWIRRFKQACSVFDEVRIDHFRGFESYYAIPYGSPDAKDGAWHKGPGMSLFDAVSREMGSLPVIAEDLGFLTPDVKKLLVDSGFPGMKVLQFAFDSREDSDYLPHNYEKNCVVYTGTHDNDTILGWCKSMSEDDRRFAMEYMGINSEAGFPGAMIRLAMSSVADRAIITMQDLLELGSEGRMNTPSTLGGNWTWRMEKGVLRDELAAQLFKTTRLFGR